jgi:hypothetical protein
MVHNMIDLSLMKNSQGKYRTTSLIKGMRNDSDLAPVYAIDDDNSDLPDMHRIYMAYDTEYEAAIQILGSFEHWQVLCESPTFRPFVEQWRVERLAREESMARKVLLEKVREGDLRAATTLIGEVKGRKKAGRPVTKGEEALKKQTHKVTSILGRLNNPGA